MTVTIQDDEGYALKNFVRTTGTRIIRQQIEKYISDLREGKILWRREPIGHLSNATLNVISFLIISQFQLRTSAHILS